MPSDSTRLVFERLDGSISIDIPVARIANDSAALAKHIARIADRPGVTHRLTLTSADLPSAQPGQSRRFRNCWRWDGSGVVVNLPAAHATVMREVRAERDRRLLESDGAHIGLSEIGTEQQKANWRAYRQALRDFPAAIHAVVHGLTSAADIEFYEVTWPGKP